MKYPSKLVLLIILALIATLAGCGPDTTEAENNLGQQPREKATSVTVQVVAPQDLKENFTLPGSLQAWEDLTLAAEIAGPVDWVGPQEGETLTAGQKILTIDSVSQKAQLGKARVDAEVKQKAMQRFKRLVGENLVSQQEYDNSFNAYETAKQSLQLARIALQKSSVKAPVAGVLDLRMVERGEYIKAGDPVAVVVQVDRLKALIDVPEKDVRYFHVGEKVRVIQAQIDTGKEVIKEGELVHIAFKADPRTRTYRAKVAVDNSDGQLRPGMIIRIEALRRELNGAVAIPLYAVVDLDGRKVVYVAESGKAQLRPVEIDRIIGEQAVIKQGLALEERLIVKGQQMLADGSPIKVEDN